MRRSRSSVPELLSLVPGLFATEAEESVRSLTSLLRMCFVEEPSSEDLYLMLGYNVRRATLCAPSAVLALVRQ